MQNRAEPGSWEASKRNSRLAASAWAGALLCWALFFGGCAEARAQFTCATNDGALTIARYSGQGGALVIPETLNGLPVTGIGDEAFCYIENLTSVVIPDSVTTVGMYAFGGCASLTNVLIGNGVTHIDHTAFHGCQSLAAITIPASVADIGEGVFDQCPNLIAIYVDTASSACSSVDGILFDASQSVLLRYPAAKPGTTYAVPTNVTRVGSDAFNGCWALTDLTIGGRVSQIGSWALVHCSNLSAIRVDASNSFFALRAFAAQKRRGIYRKGTKSKERRAFTRPRKWNAFPRPQPVAQRRHFADPGASVLLRKEEPAADIPARRTAPPVGHRADAVLEEPAGGHLPPGHQDLHPARARVGIVQFRPCQGGHARSAASWRGLPGCRVAGFPTCVPQRRRAGRGV